MYVALIAPCVYISSLILHFRSCHKRSLILHCLFRVMHFVYMYSLFWNLCGHSFIVCAIYFACFGLPSCSFVSTVFIFLLKFDYVSKPCTCWVLTYPWWDVAEQNPVRSDYITQRMALGLVKATVDVTGIMQKAVCDEQASYTVHLFVWSLSMELLLALLLMMPTAYIMCAELAALYSQHPLSFIEYNVACMYYFPVEHNPHVFQMDYHFSFLFQWFVNEVSHYFTPLDQSWMF